jgi:hypothetical protein
LRDLWLRRDQQKPLHSLQKLLKGKAVHLGDCFETQSARIPVVHLHARLRAALIPCGTSLTITTNQKTQDRDEIPNASKPGGPHVQQKSGAMGWCPPR